MKRLLFLTLATATFRARADRIGHVDTVFNFIGTDQKIDIDTYDDPEVKGVT